MENEKWKSRINSNLIIDLRSFQSITTVHNQISWFDHVALDRDLKSLLCQQNWKKNLKCNSVCCGINRIFEYKTHVSCWQVELNPVNINVAGVVLVSVTSPLAVLLSGVGPVTSPPRPGPGPRPPVSVPGPGPVSGPWPRPPSVSSVSPSPAPWFTHLNLKYRN